jgi:hypothetical protein
MDSEYIWKISSNNQFPLIITVLDGLVLEGYWHRRVITMIIIGAPQSPSMDIILGG